MSFDIPRILEELEKAGINNARVAKELNVYRSSVYRWKLGEGIRLRYLRALMALHEKNNQPVAFSATISSDS